MAAALGKLVRALGKNMDEVTEGLGKLNKNSKAYKTEMNKITQGLQDEFNTLGAKAAKWDGVDDFGALSEADQFALVDRYNTHMDTMRNNRDLRQQRMSELRDAKKPPQRTVEGKLEGESPQQAYKRQQSEARRENALTAEQRAERGQGGRSLEEYEQSVRSSEVNISPEQRAKNDELKRRLTERKIQRESGAPASNEPIRDRQANPLTAEERAQRGLGGQSKQEWDAQQKAKRRADAEAQRAERQAKADNQKAFDEAQERIDRQNKPLPRRTLDNLSEKGQKVVSNVRDTLNGTTRQNNATFATEYNEIIRNNGGPASSMIDIKGAGNLRKQFDGKSAQEVYDAQQAAMREAEEKAQEFSQWWAGKKDGIVEFAKENQMVTAAGIATAGIGGTMLLTSLLDDDDY